MLKILFGTGSQRRYSRIAGFSYLFVMATFMFGIETFSGSPTSTFIQDISPGLNSVDLLYRLEFGSLLLSSLGTLVLAYASYLIVSSFDPKLAVVVLTARSIEATLYATFAVLRFVFILYGPHTKDGYDPMYRSLESAPLEKVGGLVFNLATLCFCIGSTAFFYLLLRSLAIPRFLSALGLGAMLILLLDFVPNLIFRSTETGIGLTWIPIILAELVIAMWLLVIGTKKIQCTSDRRPSL